MTPCRFTAADHPVTPDQVLARLDAYVAALDGALARGVPADVLVAHFGRTMAAARYVLAVFLDEGA